MFSKFLRGLEPKDPFLCVFGDAAVTPEQEDTRVIPAAYLHGQSCFPNATYLSVSLEWVHFSDGFPSFPLDDAHPAIETK